MMERDFKLAIIAAVLIEAAKYLAIIGAAYIGADLLANIVILEKYKWFMFGTISATLVLFTLWLSNHFNRRQPTFPKLDPQFIFQKKTIKYKYISDQQAEYTRTYDYKPIKSGCDFYADKYRWTGTTKPQPRSLVDGQSIRETEIRNVWHFFHICFGYHLEKGKPVNSAIEWQLNNPRQAVPFVSVTIEEPTDALVLEVEFPTNIGIKRVICEHSPYMGAKAPFKSTTVELDTFGRHSWKIDKPQLLHYYEIRWNWSQQEAQI